MVSDADSDADSLIMDLQILYLRCQVRNVIRINTASIQSAYVMLLEYRKFWGFLIHVKRLPAFAFVLWMWAYNYKSCTNPLTIVALAFSMRIWHQIRLAPPLYTIKHLAKNELWMEPRGLNVSHTYSWSSHNSHLFATARRPNPKPPNATHFSIPNHAGGSSSPIIDSVPLPGRSIPVAQLNVALREELAGNTLNTNSNLLERLLPRDRLPFPVDEDLLRKLSAPIGTNPPIWNELRSSFCQPPTDFGEAAVCEWLNNIGTTMGLVFNRQCERLWWSGTCGGPLVDSSVHQKPDVILLDCNYHHRVSQKVLPGPKWAFAKALAVVHQRPNAHLTDMINVKSYLTFLCQPHRRFTISLFFINTETGQFSITVTDRAGQVRINTIDLMEPSIDNGLFLLWILAFLMFGCLEDIGLDPYFEIDPSNGKVVAIECENRRFEVVERIHALHSLLGRGTQVWIVTHNGIKYIMKDSWVREDGLHNEVAHLRRMTAHEELKGRVPTLICGGDVVINGIRDSTQHYRNARCSHRVHCRIVTSPIGESIISFKSKKEFIRVMMSIIESKLTNS